MLFKQLDTFIVAGENSKERYIVCARVVSALALAGGLAAAALHPALWQAEDQLT